MTDDEFSRPVSSEALERARAQRLKEQLADAVARERLADPDAPAILQRMEIPEVTALLAEVARREQQRDEYRGDAYDSALVQLGRMAKRAETAEAALAVARERAEKAEQERDEATRHATELSGLYLTHNRRAEDSEAALAVARERAERAGDALREYVEQDEGRLVYPGIYTPQEMARLQRARAALTDEPAADPGGPSYYAAAGYGGPRTTASAFPAAATLAEPEPAEADDGWTPYHEFRANTDPPPWGRGKDDEDVEPPASAAADEPPCCPRCGNATTEADMTYSGCGVCRAEAAAADLEDAAADEPGETP